MKINDLNIIRANVKEDFWTQPKSSTKDKLSIGSNVKIEISRKAIEFSKIKKVINNVPEIRNEKIEDLKQKIKDHAYNISPYDIAKKIIIEHLR